MGDSVYSIGNVPMQLLDARKGDLTNRVSSAGATLKNNASMAVKSFGVVGATALAADTFAGNKTVVNGAKGLVSKFLSKFKSGNLISNASKNINEVINKVKTSNVASNAKKLVEKATTSSIFQKVKVKAGDLASKINGSSVMSFLKNNKKLAIFGVGATALMGVLTKWAHNQGRIDQKYEDKATVSKNIGL